MTEGPRIYVLFTNVYNFTFDDNVRRWKFMQAEALCSFCTIQGTHIRVHGRLSEYGTCCDCWIKVCEKYAAVPLTLEETRGVFEDD